MLYPLSYGGSVPWERVPVNRPGVDTHRYEGAITAPQALTSRS